VTVIKFPKGKVILRLSKLFVFILLSLKTLF